MAEAFYTHLSPSMFDTFGAAVDRYTREWEALPETKKPYWLHWAFIQVFPHFAKKRMEERICSLEKDIFEKYAYDAAQNVIWSLAQAIRSFRAAGKSCLDTKDTAQLTADSRRILQTYTDKSMNFPELESEISGIIEAYAEGPTALHSPDELLTSLHCRLQPAIEAWCRKKKDFLHTLPQPSPDKPISSSWFSWLCERTYLLQRVGLPERPLQAAFLLEPFLIEILQAHGKTPEDYYRCADIRVQEGWHAEAQQRMNEVTLRRSQGQSAAGSETFPLPVFLRCTAAQWTRLMELLNFRYSLRDQRFIWPRERRWWEARFLLDSLCSIEGNCIIDRDQAGASNYGSMFLSLFSCGYGRQQDEAIISGRLTKSENQPGRKTTYRHRKTKQEIEQAIHRAFR